MSPLSKEEQRFLLSLARKAMAGALTGPALNLTALADEIPAGPLTEPSAAFVTLHRQGQLRGCVGHLRPGKPLYLAVADAAIAAAFHDLRFDPVTAAELSELEIEISVLSPMFAVTPEKVVPGEHGLLISDGIRRGLLLPQVAREHGWGRDQFLEETCAKAGLPRDAWRRGAAIEAFTAFVFGEEKKPPESAERISFSGGVPKKN